MQIQNNITFGGYGARPLRGLFLRRTDLELPRFNKVASQLEQIGQKHGFDVFVQTNKGIFSKDFGLLSEGEYLRGDSHYVWCQDNITFLKDRFLASSNVISKLNYELGNFIGKTPIETRSHIPGGNYFIIDDNGKRKLLLGRDNSKDIDKLKSLLGINSIKLLSQSDFHLDLFIRPLKNKTVLVADDKIWFDRINKVIKAIDKDPSLSEVCEKLVNVRNKLCIMVAQMPNFKYAHLSKVQEELKNDGYKIVKVPGRIFQYANDEDGVYLQHLLNYMNGIVLENKDGELIYITNRSNLNKYCGITKKVAQKIRFDFETEFINSIRDYIKPENIYFVDSYRFLKYSQGGIHCLAAEIPKF